MARVLIYSLEHPRTRGGLNAVVENLCRDLSYRGHDVLRVWPWDGRSFVPISSTTVRYKPMKLGTLSLSRMIVPSVLKRTIKFRKEIVDLIQDEHIQVVNTHFFDNSAAYFLSAARVAGASGLASVQGSDIHFSSDFIAKKARLNFLSCIPDQVTLASEKMKKHFLGIKKLQNKLNVIHNGVPISRWLSLQNKDSNLTPNSPFKIIGVGKLKEVKGFDLSIRGIACLVHEHKMRDILYTIVGDGVLREHLEALVKDLDLEKYIRFVGYRSQTELADLYSSSKVFLMTSRAEGGPATLIEAMAYGLYIVATDVGYAPESINLYGYGDVLDSFEPCKIAKALVNARSKISESAFKNMKVVEVFDWEKTVYKYERLINFLAS